jgi:UDP-3-O-[3-hydroxymyristoyl] glucosamine N-acyltransferase
MSHTSRIYPNVSIGSGCNLGDFTIIGEPPRGKAAGELPTVIGVGAIIRSHTVVYAGNRIGDRFETGHGVLVREENQIGHDVSIGSHTVVEHHVVIGIRHIHSGAFIPGIFRLRNGVLDGRVSLRTPLPHSRKIKAMLRGPVIKSRARIGAGAVLLPGVTIGPRCAGRSRSSRGGRCA